MPITRPRASPRGPPEFPGASLRSARMKLDPAVRRGPIAWITPAVTAPTSPNGLPTATTRSPTRKRSESPTSAADRPSASSASAARSYSGSHASPRASMARPPGSTTAAVSLATCAFVTISPLEIQITPDPVPPLDPWTWTVMRLSRSVTAVRSPSIAGGLVSCVSLCPGTSASPLRPLADGHTHLCGRARAQNRRRDRRAGAPRSDDGLHVFRGADGGAVEGDQDVAEQNARLRGGAVGLDVDNEQSDLGRPGEPAPESLGQACGLEPQTEEATADMAFVDQLVSDARHRRDRNGQLELPRQPRGVDPHDTPLHIHERASGEAGVERQVQPHELIDLPAAPRPPAAPEGAYDAPAHARPVSHRQHDVAHLERARIAEVCEREIGVVDPKYGQIGPRITR